MTVPLEQLNLPAIVAEVAGVFAAYEAALLANDAAALNAFFLASASTVRLGVAEHAFGIRSIEEQRARLPKISTGRRLHNTVITTWGTDLAAVSTEFAAPDTLLLGRQSQTWVRTVAGWKILAAHVSTIASPVTRSFDATAPVQSRRE